VPNPAITQTVWSLGLRLLHWTLAISMITSFATHEGAGKLHEITGYVALAAALLRVLMGFAGRGYWRFTQFVRGLPTTLRYARDVLAHQEARYVGHNPLGGWMVLALLADAIATGLTGWLFTTDRFWGVAWLEDLHSVLGHLLIPLLVLHLAGVVFTSWRHRENLVAAMLHGKKPVPKLTDLG
jgi:cytochrome b